MPSVTITTIPRKKSNIPMKEIDDEAVLVSLFDGDYIMLNETGRFIWKNIDGDKDLKTLSEQLVTSYSVDKDDAFKDLLEFTTLLYKMKLIDIE